MLKFSNQKPPEKSPDGKEQGSSGEGSDGKKPNDDGDKMISVLTKTILWMVTIYMLVAVVSTILPNRNNPETSTRYVSWHEFVHHMLAVGEVKQLIVRPDMEMVTIILNEGAIIKGRRATSNVFHMAIADTSTFEEKLRDVEKRLGVSESNGLTVQYERNSDTASKLVISLLVAAVMISLLSRMKGGKAPMSMDSFVRSI